MWSLRNNAGEVLVNMYGYLHADIISKVEFKKRCRSSRNELAAVEWEMKYLREQKLSKSEKYVDEIWDVKWDKPTVPLLRKAQKQSRNAKNNKKIII